MSIKVNGKLVSGRGADGKSAYQSAVDGGFTGTETDFNVALGKIDSLPDDYYSKTEADQKFATQQSLNSVSSNVSNMQTVVNGHTEDITQLKSRVTSAETDIGELQTAVADLEGDFSDFATKTELSSVQTIAENAQETAETASTAANQANTKATSAQNTAEAAQDDASDALSTANSANSKATTNANDISDLEEIVGKASSSNLAAWCTVGNRRNGAIVFSSGCWLPNRTTGGTIFSTVIGHLLVQSGDTLQIGTNVPGFFSSINGANVYGLDGTQLSGSSSVTNAGKGININITSNGRSDMRGVVIAFSAPSA